MTLKQLKIIPLIIGFTLSCIAQSSTISNLSEDEAVAMAEKFIIVNGFTNLPANEICISLGENENRADLQKILQSRKNLIKKSAYGISFNRFENKKGWSVVFRFNKFESKKYGLAVTMDLDGKNIRIEKAKFLLNMVDKVL